MSLEESYNKLISNPLAKKTSVLFQYKPSSIREIKNTPQPSYNYSRRARDRKEESEEKEAKGTLMLSLSDSHSNYNSTNSQSIQESISISDDDSLQAEDINSNSFSIHDYERIKAVSASKNDRTNYPEIPYDMFEDFINVLNTKKLIGYTMISNSSISCLDRFRWYNDEIVNAYAKLINQENKEDSGRLGYPRVFCLNTYFYEKLLQVFGKKKEYCKLQKFWCNKTYQEDLFEYDHVLIPVNLNRNHWVLVSVNLNTKTCTYYDSLGGVDFSTVKQITQFFDDYFTTIPEFNKEWKYYAPTIPKQKNSHDCGVFICKFMDYISRGNKFNFSHDDMDYFRILIGIQICNTQLNFNPINLDDEDDDDEEEDDDGDWFVVDL